MKPLTTRIQLQTKTKLATAFKSLMQEKQFDAITITDITSRAKMSRLTFYYHFQDKLELLNWIFLNDVIYIVKDGLSLDTWPENTLKGLKVIYNDKQYYQSALVSERGEFKNSIFSMLKDVFICSIESIASDYDNRISIEEVDFMSDLFAHGLSDVLIKNIIDGMPIKPKEFVAYMESVVNDCKSLAIMRTEESK